MPFLATQPGAPDFGHAEELSAVVAIVLLVLFAVSVPISIRLATEAPGVPSRTSRTTTRRHAGRAAAARSRRSPSSAVSAASAAFVADWFVEALEPAMATIGMSEAFAGLIVVAHRGQRRREPRRASPRPRRARATWR